MMSGECCDDWKSVKLLAQRSSWWAWTGPSCSCLFFGIQFDDVDIVICTVSLMTACSGPSDVSLERLRAMPESARGDPAIHESLR